MSITADKLLQLAAAPNKYLVNELIPTESLTLCSGDSGVGKTWLALQIAIAAITGRPFLDKFTVPTPLPSVMYVNSDMGVAQMQAYLRSAIVGMSLSAAEHHEVLSRLHFHGNSGFSTLSSASGFDLEPLVADIPAGCGLVIIDTFRAAFSVDENQQNGVSSLFRALKQEVVFQTCPVLVLHHINKQGLQYRTERGRVSGSTAFISDASAHLSVTKKRDLIQIGVDKSRTGAAGIKWCGRLEFAESNGIPYPRFIEASAGVAVPSNPNAKILQRLASLPSASTGFTAKDVQAAGLDISKAVLDRLTREAKLHATYGPAGHRGGRGPKVYYLASP